MNKVGALLVVMAVLPSFAQTQPSPGNAMDDDFRRKMVTVWTKVVDDIREHAINKAKSTGLEIDPDTEIEPFLKDLARDPYFDVVREYRMHPGYHKYVERIAALRGLKLKPPNPIYRYGLGFILLAIPASLLAAWSRRITKKTSAERVANRASFYGLVLLKMSWRMLLVIIICLVIVVIFDTAANESDAETARKIVAIIPGLVLVCSVVILVTSWKTTKARLAEFHPLSSK